MLHVCLLLALTVQYLESSLILLFTSASDSPMQLNSVLFFSAYQPTEISSSAVAKRLCLSVVSFNSTKRRAQSFIISLVNDLFPPWP